MGADNPFGFFIVAGEASGDALGGRLIPALYSEFGDDIQISGVGGQAMLAAGMKKSLFPMEELSVMGIAEILPKIFDLKKRIDQTVSEILSKKPDVLITIDSPDFCFRVAKKVKKLAGKNSPKIVHYVAPSVWAWREGRAKKVARFLDGLICLLPFEPPYFEKEGLRAEFVGHSLIESFDTCTDRTLYRKRNNIPEEAVLLGVLPGSRLGEIRRTGSVLFDSLDGLMKEYPGLHVVIPTLPHIEDVVRDATRQYADSVHIESDPRIKSEVFAACNLAMATSGTVGLELVVAGVPHIITYKMNRLTWEVVRRVVKVKYAHIANIVSDKEIVPEFIQEKCTPENITRAVSLMIDLPEVRMKHRSDYMKIKEKISGGAEQPSPSEKAARFIVKLL